MRGEEMRYSEIIKGVPRNFNWSVRYDLTADGFLGITQFDGDKVTDRVLLSPNQVDQLIIGTLGQNAAQLGAALEIICGRRLAPDDKTAKMNSSEFAVAVLDGKILVE